MSTQPLCIAPWTNILIDTNKGVKPCCAYMDDHLGNIKETNISDIVSGEKWADLKNKLLNQEWTKGCYKGCKSQEDKHGWSPRLGFQPVHFQNEASTDPIQYEDGAIVYLEFNGSNICNLACLHCGPAFSSKWIPEWERLFPDSKGTFKNNLPDTDLITSNLKQLDLSRLKYVHFKGGDPMYNDETLTVLEHLDQLGIIANIEFTMFSNGSIVNEKVVELLSKAKMFTYCVSVDGMGKLNEYIRYKDSSIETIIRSIEKIDAMPNVQLTLSVSTMVYNIFNLVEIRDFWLEMANKHKFVKDVFFNIVVTNPIYLNPAVLSDPVRQQLVDYYTKNQIKNEFGSIIKSLSNPYLGDEIHNEWVTYTRKMEAMRGNRIEDIVPELANELVIRQ